MASSGFRDWLATRLLGTKYATISLEDDEIDAVAKQLGVDPDLLLEVRAQARVALHSRGLSPALSNSKRVTGAVAELGHRLYQFKIWMPRAIREEWRQECERRGTHPPTLMRSLIHDYLLGEREPAPEAHWRWRGKLYRSHLRIAEFAVIPRGAKRALMRRAASRGTSPTPVVRALVLEALAGQHSEVPLVPASMMFDDENRYNTGK